MGHTCTLICAEIKLLLCAETQQEQAVFMILINREEIIILNNKVLA